MLCYALCGVLIQIYLRKIIILLLSFFIIIFWISFGIPKIVSGNSFDIKVLLDLDES